MSPHNNNNATWDPTQLQLNHGGAAGSQGSVHRGRRASPIRGKFIAGPVDVSWVCQASRLGVKALLVGLSLWHLRGLRRSDTFIVSNLMVREWGIEPDAKSRALRTLEKAGLIAVERRGKRNPLVTLMVGMGETRGLPNSAMDHEGVVTPPRGAHCRPGNRGVLR
jgi:DNA-binding transcriptional ArsR family regulator